MSSTSPLFTSVCVSYDINMLIALSDAELLQAVRGGTAFELRSQLGVMRAMGIKGLVAKECDRQSREGFCLGHPSYPEGYCERA